MNGNKQLLPVGSEHAQLPPASLNRKERRRLAAGISQPRKPCACCHPVEENLGPAQEPIPTGPLPAGNHPVSDGTDSR
jgi:hypothetical protein